jgi:CII-binding regulator of phage lambda lysogenization HflD
MNIINENPYRILGLLAASTAKEQNRQIKRLKQYLNAGQEPPHDDYSFAVLGNLNRTIESVENAEAKLNLDKDKMEASLFWFYNGNAITDEPAFEYLKEGNIAAAYQIWDKLITETKEDGKRFWKAVTEKNHSAFHNCFVANLLMKNGSLHNAIAGNLYFLESSLVQNFIGQVTDKTYKTTSKELQLTFLNAISNEIAIDRIFPIIKAVNFAAKEDFLRLAVQKQIEPIERKIEASKAKRKANKANAAATGNELYKAVAADLEKLKSILAANDMKYAAIADKVAEEVLQCGIDYFLHYKDTDSDPSKNAMALFNLAKGLAVGAIAKQRIKEHIEVVEEYQLRDCYRAVAVLKAIKDVYIQVSSMFGQTVNEYAVINLIREEITDKVVRELAESGNQKLIKEFYDLLIHLQGKMTNNTNLFQMEKILCDNLPTTSKFKAKVQQKIADREQKENDQNSVTSDSEEQAAKQIKVLSAVSKYVAIKIKQGLSTIDDLIKEVVAVTGDEAVIKFIIDNLDVSINTGDGTVTTLREEFEKVGNPITDEAETKLRRQAEIAYNKVITGTSERQEAPDAVKPDTTPSSRPMVNYENDDINDNPFSQNFIGCAVLIIIGLIIVCLNNC